jgi:hypothetical protein
MTETTTPLTADQITAEEQSRAQLAKALADRTAKFNQQAQPVVVAVEPKTPLAATLAKLSAPAPVAPPRDLHLTRAQLDPLLRKARELMAKYAALQTEIGDRAGDYAALDMARITRILPPTTESENWARLNALVNAAKEIVTTFQAVNYSEMAKLVPIVQKFATGEIEEYQDPVDRSRALYNAGVATRYMTQEVAKFANVVNALANNLKTITLMEPLVAADLLVVQAAPAVAEPAPERLALNQRLPNERPKSYADSGDPRVIFAEPTQPDTAKVTEVAGGTHIETVRRPANG